MPLTLPVSLSCKLALTGPSNITIAFPKLDLLLVFNLPAAKVKKLGMQDNSEPREVTTALAADLRVFAGQKWPTMNHKWRKARLASLLGMSERRVKSIYEAEETARIRSDEEARIRALIGQEVEDAALAGRIADLEAQVAFLVAALAGDEVAAGRSKTHPSSNGGTGQGQAVPSRRSTDRT